MCVWVLGKVKPCLFSSTDVTACCLFVDETAVAAMALSCAAEGVPEARVGMNRAVAYLRAQRRLDGSYGNAHTTALVLQVTLAVLDFRFWILLSWISGPVLPVLHFRSCTSGPVFLVLYFRS